MAPQELGKLVDVDLADPGFWDRGLDIIERRLEAARSEMRRVDEFDYVIINNDFAAAVEDFLAIVRGSRLRRDEQRQRYPDLFETLLELD